MYLRVFLNVILLRAKISQNWSKLRNLCGLQTPPTMIRYLDYTNLYVDSYLS